ncbi:MAG: hypothetical protein JSR54_16565, partial [Proteobacteria bacterium]|nr:hypothetical protein [Pseudomonadota bacterium]
MPSVLLLGAVLGAGFAHPTPAPPAELPVAEYQARRARVLAELGGCVAVLSAQGAPSGVT